MYEKILEVIRDTANKKELEIKISITQMKTLAESIAEMVEQEFAERLGDILMEIDEA